MNQSNVIILAAGYSERMGKPKFSLPFTEKTTFLEHFLEVYSNFGVHKIIIISQLPNKISKYTANYSNCILIQNIFPEKGKTFSLSLGLKESENQDVFIQNIDNPFIDFELLKILQKNLISQKWVRPVYKNSGGHPILLSKEVVFKIKEKIDVSQNLRTLLNEYERIDIETNEEKILANINTPADYKKHFNLSI